jgi:hypothetical protein
LLLRMQAGMQMPQMLLSAGISGQPIAERAGEVIAGQGSTVMGHQRELGDPYLVEEGLKLARHPLLTVVAGAFVRLAVAFQIDSDTMVLVAQ